MNAPLAQVAGCTAARGRGDARVKGIERMALPGGPRIAFTRG